MPVISTAGLARTFQTKHGPVEAVRGIDLTVRPGEILGFLGPNGAGKTTTLRMLTTLLPPTGGAATVAGHDLARDPAGVRRKIGYVAQSGGVDPSVSVREELTTQGRLYRLGKAEATARAEELAADLGLTELLDRKCGALSGGQRRRLDIAMGLTHRPAVLFLDEPTTGLDPGSRADLWELIRRLRAPLPAQSQGAPTHGLPSSLLAPSSLRGSSVQPAQRPETRSPGHAMTVFLTTHYLDEAEALADRLVIVDKGTVVAEGTAARLKAEYGGSPDATLQDAFIAITGRGAQRPDPDPIAV
ncbi:ATP-binding cassette domain-containing protein [Streptomyces sp. NPDC005970]|uniref:ABC transporter ATP-binding protein n=1 Tax=Streptomyces sp. NPDC005970 TaxID=3156723 RepID=UPI0033D5835A